MKRVKRNPAKFETLKLFDFLSKESGYTFEDTSGSQEFLSQLERAFEEAKSNPAALHGLRVEAMFEYLAVALGKCAFVKHEDAGQTYIDAQDLIPPDFRIVLKDGPQFFVEAKNFYQGDALAPFRVKAEYFEKLGAYAELLRCGLKIAVYWSRWNIWTLSSASLLKQNNGRFELDLMEAMKHNEMGLIGDRMIGTIPPLIFRVFTDPAQNRKVSESGKVQFTIGSVEIYSGDTRIEDPLERNLAFYFMLYGDWQEDSRAEVKNGELISFEFSFEPPERAEGQGFEIVGRLSGMIARHYNAITAPEGKVMSLSPASHPERFRIELPEGCKGKQLPLWCFNQTVE